MSNIKSSVHNLITKTITGRTNLNDGITTICVNGNLTDNPQFILESFNSYFLSIAEKIVNKIQSIRDSNSNFSPITCLSNVFKKPFPQIKFNYVSRHEIEKIIKSLKSSNS
jgi:hypothetical protein